MKRLVLHPGYVGSIEDGDLHWVPAHQLANLYHVPIHECVTLDERRPETFQGHTDEYLDKLLHLWPRRVMGYERIAESRRLRYPLGRPLSPKPTRWQRLRRWISE